MRFEAALGSPRAETWVEGDRQVSATGSVPLAPGTRISLSVAISMVVSAACAINTIDPTRTYRCDEKEPGRWPGSLS